MSYYTVTVRRIEVIGTIRMPPITAATFYDLSTYDVDNIRTRGNGKLTRDAVEDWLGTKRWRKFLFSLEVTAFGDFQGIQDFHADIEDFDSPWADPESEFTFSDCMYREED